MDTSKNNEWQVVSLELSKQLKESGYEQEGIWWWEVDLLSIGHKPEHKVIISSDKDKINSDEFEYFVAPTVAELGEALPHHMFNRLLQSAPYCKDLKDSRWCVSYFHSYAKPMVHKESEQYADTEANARAKMWLYLKKEKLI